MTPIQEQRYKPKYKIISEHLREQIINRKFTSGQALPSQRELMTLYEASQSTVRQSLAELSHAGLLRAEPGKGVYVQSPQDLDQQHDQRRLGTTGFIWWYHAWSPRDEGRHIDRVYLYIMRVTADTLQRSNRETLYAQFNHGIEEQNYKMQAFSQGLGGLVIVGEVDPSLLKQMDLPLQRIVIAGHTLHENSLETFSNVVVDVESAGTLSVQLLASAGHQRLALVNGEGSLFFQGLELGFRDAARSLNLPEPRCFVANDVKTEEEVAQVIAKDEDITGVIVMGDSNAERMIRNLNRKGVHVPQHKSVLGIGGLPRAEMAFNDMSRINIGYDRIARECANLIAADTFVVTHKSVPAKVELGDTITAPRPK